jgi:hypothetical protein
MLESLATIPYWTKTIFHIKLDEEFQDQTISLQEYTKNLFDKKTMSYYSDRIEYQKDWRNHLTEVFDDKDELVWFLCNDDHIFMDYDLKSIESALSILEGCKGQMASFFFSHYPEALKAVAHQKHKLASNELFYYDGGNVDSIQLVTKQVLKRWFIDNETTNRFMPRPDWETGFVQTDLTRHLVPIKECCRHFEGYPMVNIDPNHCPPLDIPPGFFSEKRNIKISYGFSTQGTVSFNPLARYYSITDTTGADYKLLPEDIPLFWRPKLLCTHYKPDCCNNYEEAVRARNDAVWKIANSRPNQPEYVIDYEKVMAVAGRKTH